MGAVTGSSTPLSPSIPITSFTDIMAVILGEILRYGKAEQVARWWSRWCSWKPRCAGDSWSTTAAAAITHYCRFQHVWQQLCNP